MLASETKEVHDQFLDDIGEGGVFALPFLFEFWALEHQMPPDGDWRTWIVMGGRGAGKTRAGSEWVRSQVEGARPRDPGVAKRVALIGETYDQARDVMVHSDSGILACCPPDRRPVWKGSERKLVWPNKAEAQVFSAQDPEALRGPQFDAAWVDELAKWKKGQDAWEMLQFALGLGDDPRACVTTTPRNVPVLKDLLARSSTVTTHAPTEANRANLAAGFLEEVRARHAGTWMGRQELDGELIEDIEGALWSAGQLDRLRVDSPPPLDRIVVAVDPSVSAGGDACGIVVAGVSTSGPPQTWRACVLEDCTVTGQSPLGWGEAAVAAFHRYQADRLVAETNQGGALVRQMLNGIDPMLPVRTVHASRGKAARAEPVAALYEQGRVTHLRHLQDLEDQMCQMTVTGYTGKGSPDRLDALVWAIYALMIEPASGWQSPGIRLL